MTLEGTHLSVGRAAKLKRPVFSGLEIISLAPRVCGGQWVSKKKSDTS